MICLHQSFSIRSALSILCLFFLLDFACTVDDSQDQDNRNPKPVSSNFSPPSISNTQAHSSPVLPPGMDHGVVTRVIDGDTVEVLVGGETHNVRYIGIDTPETKHPRTGVECFGPEATIFNERLVEDRNIFLEEDVTNKDRYGRLLRYLWIENVGLVNLILVEQGYARVSTYPPDVKYEDQFIAAERSAKVNGYGQWKECKNPARSTEAGLPDESVNQPVSGCSPHYPTVCIPPYPPDLDCRQISQFEFMVLPPDPHRFDGNNDGIGCER